MTLVAAWIRKTPGGQELVVASDSRISGGLTLDHAPKIFRLERSDAVLAYCGSTLVAYPLILQIQAGLDAYEESRNRVIDIVHLKSHIEKIIERLRNSISYCPGTDDNRTSFKILLAGYSWKVNDFCVWTFKFNVKTGEFNAYKMGKGHKFQFMSDNSDNEYRARTIVMKKIGFTPEGNVRRLDWEPLAALVELIEDPATNDIGGAPQIVKIYRHANTMPINVLWPETIKQNGCSANIYRVTHLGRSLLDYERSRYLTLDPVSLELIEPWKIKERIQRENARAIENIIQYEKNIALHYLYMLIRKFKEKKHLQDTLTKMIACGSSFQELLVVMNKIK